MTTSLTRCSLDTLAKVLGVTPRRVQQLAFEGHVVKAGRGEYELAGSIRQYIAHCESRIEAKEGSEGSLSAARRGLIEVQTEKTKYELSILRHEWTSNDQVRDLLNTMTEHFIQGIEALPGRLAVDLVNQSHPGVVRQKIKEECNALRNTLADQLSKWNPHERKPTLFSHRDTIEEDDDAESECLGG